MLSHLGIDGHGDCSTKFFHSTNTVATGSDCSRAVISSAVVKDTMEFHKLLFKASVCFFFFFFFFFPPNDSFSMINAFYFIWKTLFILKILKFLYLSFHLIFPVGHCFRGWLKINLRAWQIACTVISVHEKRLSHTQNYVHVNQS